MKLLHFFKINCLCFFCIIIRFFLFSLFFFLAIFLLIYYLDFNLNVSVFLINYIIIIKFFINQPTINNLVKTRSSIFFNPIQIIIKIWFIIRTSINISTIIKIILKIISSRQLF